MSYNGGMIRLCNKHGRASHFKRGDGTFRCGRCASQWVVNNRINKKKKLVELFGGKCKVCGYNTYAGALDFHHKDPSKKSFSLSVRGLCYAWDSVLAEANKCILLCKNCHSEVGAGIVKI